MYIADMIDAIVVYEVLLQDEVNDELVQMGVDEVVETEMLDDVDTLIIMQVEVDDELDGADKVIDEFELIGIDEDDEIEYADIEVDDEVDDDIIDDLQKLMLEDDMTDDETDELMQDMMPLIVEVDEVELDV